MIRKETFNLQHSHVVELYSRGFTLDVMFYLEQLSKGVDLYAIDEYRLKGIILTMERKGLIDDRKITEKGNELLEFLGKKGESLKITKAKGDDFDVWWDVYPATNMFTFKGKTFPGVQSKRLGKEKCRLKFKEFVANGIFSAEDIIKATEFHILVAKEQSWKKKSNELSFIPNSERYLREKMFAPYIELYKLGKTGEEEEVRKIINTKDLF